MEYKRIEHKWLIASCATWGVVWSYSLLLVVALVAYKIPVCWLQLGSKKASTNSRIYTDIPTVVVLSHCTSEYQVWWYDRQWAKCYCCAEHVFALDQQSERRTWRGRCIWDRDSTKLTPFSTGLGGSRVLKTVAAIYLLWDNIYLICLEFSVYIWSSLWYDIIANHT